MTEFCKAFEEKPITEEHLAGMNYLVHLLGKQCKDLHDQITEMEQQGTYNPHCGELADLHEKLEHYNEMRTCAEKAMRKCRHIHDEQRSKLHDAQANCATPFVPDLHIGQWVYYANRIGKCANPLEIIGYEVYRTGNYDSEGKCLAYQNKVRYFVNTSGQDYVPVLFDSDDIGKTIFTDIMDVSAVLEAHKKSEKEVNHNV